MASPLISAFPARLTPGVSRLAALLDPPSGLDTSEPFTVTCDGEVIQIPHRLYRPVISESQFASLHPVEQSIAGDDCVWPRNTGATPFESGLRAGALEKVEGVC